MGVMVGNLLALYRKYAVRLEVEALHWKNPGIIL